MKIEIQDTATPALREKIATLGNRKGLHAEMGMAVEREVLRHLRGLGARPNRLGAPSTGFWKKAADSVVGRADSEAATVSIPARGVALQYYGGTVTPKRGEWLTIPIHAMAHGRSAREIGVRLYFFTSKKGNLILATDPKGGLGSGRGGRKASSGLRRRSGYRGGVPLYVLKRSARILPHPDVLPGQLVLSTAATRAAERYFL